MTMRMIDLTGSEIDVEAKFNDLTAKLDAMNRVLAGIYPTVPNDNWIISNVDNNENRYVRSFKGTLQSLEFEFTTANLFNDVGSVKLTDFVTGYAPTSLWIANNGCNGKFTDITTPGNVACKVNVGLLSPSTVGMYIVTGVNTFCRFRKVKINGMPVDFKYA